MGAAETAVLPHFEFVRRPTLVLGAVVVPPFALLAGERDEIAH
jgi:hypothetical protein